MTSPALAGINTYTNQGGSFGIDNICEPMSTAQAAADCLRSWLVANVGGFGGTCQPTAATITLTGTSGSTYTYSIAGNRPAPPCASTFAWGWTYQFTDNCVAPATHVPLQGCYTPPDCSAQAGLQADRFFADTGPGGAICANPPGSESTECDALVAEPSGVRACADGECFARLIFTGDQCGSEPDATGETLVDEPGDTNCVGGGGVTFCARQDSMNCGTVNGEAICLESVPPGRCAFLGNGGLLCGSTADGPTESDGVTPADPDGEFTAASEDSAEDDFRYFAPGTVASSGTPVSGTSSSGGSDPGTGEEPGAGPCDEEGSCPGTLPELGETETFADATSAFLGEVQGSPLFLAATSIGASWPAGECPAPTATIAALGDVELTLDAHCTLWEEWGEVLGAVLLGLFVFLGARIILSA